MNIPLFPDFKKEIQRKRLHRKKGLRGQKANNIVDHGKDVIPTPPPTPTQSPASTPTTTLETEDVDLNAQSAEDMRMESLATESPGKQLIRNGLIVI